MKLIGSLINGRLAWCLNRFWSVKAESASRYYEISRSPVDSSTVFPVLGFPSLRTLAGSSAPARPHSPPVCWRIISTVPRLNTCPLSECQPRLSTSLSQHLQSTDSLNGSASTLNIICSFWTIFLWMEIKEEAIHYPLSLVKSIAYFLWYYLLHLLISTDGFQNKS